MSTDRFQRLENGNRLGRKIAENAALAVWFSGPDCGVRGNLKPKLEALLSTKLRAIALIEVNCAEQPETLQPTWYSAYPH